MAYDSIKLEKGMYSKGLTKALETMDPSYNYTGTELSGLDAYERQLKRFGIKVKGAGSDILESFFQTPDSAVLFPEFVQRAVTQGMESVSVLKDLAATITKIDGNDYRSLSLESMGTLPPAVAEGGTLSVTTVGNKTNLVSMKKRGRVISSSYETLRNKRLDAFAMALRQVGVEIARGQVADAVSVLLTGDNNDAAISTVAPVSTGSIAYKDLLALWAGLAPYEMNTIIASMDTLQNILSLAEMRDATAGLNFQGSGKMVTPLGATLVCGTSLAANTIIGLDRTCALEMVKAGDVVVDSSNLIDRHMEKILIVATAGFTKLFNSAAKKMTIASS